MTPAFTVHRPDEDARHSSAAVVANAHGMSDGLAHALQQASQARREFVNSSTRVESSKFGEFINKFNGLINHACGNAAFSNMTYRSCSVRLGRV